jgi:hypothetical protein
MARKATPAARQKGQRQAARPHEDSNESEPGRSSVVFGQGMLTKEGSGYLDTIVANIKEKLGHPRHLGVQMQAHHLISATSVKQLPKGVKINLEYFNYNINNLNNLVFLPCTLQGACHLGIQPHRGNHTTLIGSLQDAPDEDAGHRRDYHNMVKDFLMTLAPLIKKKCAGDCTRAEMEKLVENVGKKLNTTSAVILTMIKDEPTEAPLTKLAAHFQPGNPVGCAGVDSVNGRNKGKDHGNHQCPVHRNHLLRQGEGQDVEGIRYQSAGHYAVKAGF